MSDLTHPLPDGHGQEGQERVTPVVQTQDEEQEEDRLILSDTILEGEQDEEEEGTRSSTNTVNEGEELQELRNEGGALYSLRYYDQLRMSATNVIREEGSNIDYFTVTHNDGQEEEIALCHLSSILPFTYGDFVPRENTYEDAANIMLAAHHLNVGDGSIVPEVAGLNQRCPVRFTTEFADTEFQGGVSLNLAVEQANRDPLQGRRPCAFVGAYLSSISIPLSIVTGLLGYPQISPGSTSADLDDTSQYPLFGRTVPSDQENSIPIIIYLRHVLNIKHLAVVNINDAYGNAYVEGMRRAVEQHAPDMKLHQIPLDKEAIPDAVRSLKNTGYRYVFCLIFTPELHDRLLEEAYRQGVAGTGLHNWLFGDSFGGTLDSRSFVANSPLHLAYRGVGKLELAGGVPGISSFDRYEAKIKSLREKPEDLEYIGSLFPKHDHPSYPSTPPFVDTDAFLSSASSQYAPFAYEAIIALGLAACKAHHENKAFSGQEHFDKFKQTTFTGISNKVVFDTTTGSRNPRFALHKVANYVEEVAPDDMVRFKPVVTDLFLDGEWQQQQEYIFNDGTTNLPQDLPPVMQVQDEQLNLTLIIVVPVVACFLFGMIMFWFYETKRKQSDAMWTVREDELTFPEKPKIVGRGSFGVVLLAEYRGTQVAVKRVIPPKSDKQGGRLDSGLPISLDMEAPGKFAKSGASRNADNYTSHNSGSSMNWRKKKRDFVEEMRHLSKLRHSCVITIMGAVMGDDPMLIMEFMAHGSLHDLLHNETMVIDSELLLPMLRDISQGVRFLHSATPCVIHGDLKSANILVDERFRAKVADFGLSHSQKHNIGGGLSHKQSATGTPFWMAPELLRGENTNTVATDVFSFGIILYEVYSRRDPYHDDDGNPREVLRMIADKTVKKRPPSPRHMPDAVKALYKDCIEDDPDLRPTVEELDIRLKRISAEVDAIDQANKTSAHVSLFDIFPRHIAEALRHSRKVDPEHRDSVTIFFSDIVGFTTISSKLPPEKVADMLDRLYTKFDELSRKHDVFKVETVGDAYMAVTNLVKDQHNDHAKRIALFATEAVVVANETPVDPDDPSKGFINIRAGFHVGPVVADVVGTRNPRYCLFGDTVNTASRMESHSLPNRIQCSHAAAKLVAEQIPEMPMSSRGNIKIKGKGRVLTYFINEQGIGPRRSLGVAAAGEISNVLETMSTQEEGEDEDQTCSSSREVDWQFQKAEADLQGDEGHNQQSGQTPEAALPFANPATTMDRDAVRGGEVDVEAPLDATELAEMQEKLSKRLSV